MVANESFKGDLSYFKIAILKYCQEKQIVADDYNSIVRFLRESNALVNNWTFRHV
jgi:hypothetical protein